jgi:hypothetical protein
MDKWNGISRQQDEKETYSISVIHISLMIQYSGLWCMYNNSESNSVHCHFQLTMIDDQLTMIVKSHHIMSPNLYWHTDMNPNTYLFIVLSSPAIFKEDAPEGSLSLPASLSDIQINTLRFTQPASASFLKYSKKEHMRCALKYLFISNNARMLQMVCHDRKGVPILLS